MKQQQYKVGIYARLSNEDTRDGDSVSIENQKLILTNYADKNRWEVVDYYIDDGYSGVNFDRPAIKQLLVDVQLGRINLVLVKDQSRFGRNVIEAGMIKQTFEDNNIRLIAVDDNFDTANGFDIMSMFRDVFNEWFIADTSKKIRAVKKAKFESGKFMSYKAPFGYVKSQEDKHKLVIDPPAAEIIRMIFDLRCKGYGFRKIAIMLNDDKVVTPRQYHPNISGKKVVGTPFWNANTISKILRNEVYIGHLVQGKNVKASYKSKKTTLKPKNEWIRVENTHEPIIDTATWDLIYELDTKPVNTRTNKKGELTLFSGMLRCLDCGYGMKVNHRKHGKKTYHAYSCGRYAACGKSVCTYHFISLLNLEKLVIGELRKHASRALSEESIYREELLTQRNEGRISQRKAYETKLKKSQRRVDELEKLIQSAYEDKVLGSLSVESFKKLATKYEGERDDLTAIIEEIQTRLAESDSDLADVDSFLSAMKKYASIEKLDREILLELIDKIEIGEVYEENGTEIRDVVIHYRFVDTIGTVA
jgi:DNA invertase Pin-like site-specific DNA recombinase